MDGKGSPLEEVALSRGRGQEATGGGLVQQTERQEKRPWDRTRCISREQRQRG